MVRGPSKHQIMLKMRKEHVVGRVPAKLLGYGGRVDVEDAHAAIDRHRLEAAQETLPVAEVAETPIVVCPEVSSAGQRYGWVALEDLSEKADAGTVDAGEKYRWRIPYFHSITLLLVSAQRYGRGR